VTEKLPDVWTTRDFPVLVEVARRIDAGDQTPRVEEVAATLDMPVEQVQLAGAALKRRGLVDAFGAWQAEILRFRNLSGEAYFLTGLHPSGDDAVAALVDALRQAADQVDDPQEKSRLRTLADNALGVGRDVLGGVLVNLATKGMLG
jgi:DNA-binding transcriptional MocR family regulator